MTIRVGINGFGRIGRNFWRAVNAADGDRGFEIVAANDLGDIATMAHLLKYDTVLGTLPADVSVAGDVIRVGDKSIKILAEREPAKLPWRDLGADNVIESTGRFTTGPAARRSAMASRRRIRPAMASLVSGGSASWPSSSRLACRWAIRSLPAIVRCCGASAPRISRARSTRAPAATAARALRRRLASSKLASRFAVARTSRRIRRSSQARTAW